MEELSKNTWDKRIQKANKFLEPALTHGRAVYERYEDKRDASAVGSKTKRANIFYANVNTIKESLFNSLPKPSVSRLHKGDYEDDVARVASLIMQRALNYEVQCAEYFEAAVKSAIQDRLVPGIGQAWVRFDMRDNPNGEQTEAIFLDTVFWEDFIWEPARSWEAVTWCGRRLDLTKGEVVERWGEEGLTQLQHPKLDTNTPKQINSDKYEVYEIWDKKKRKVFFIAVGSEYVLEEREDPYKLAGFFPCPRPLIASPVTAAFLPVTDYHQAQDQYNQLDVLYARIALIISAIKVAGCYDSAEVQTIGKMLQGQENTLVPVDNWAMYAEKGGAKGMIDWYPVEQCVGVLQALTAQFEMIKGLLGEISGMADIVRGDTNQYETAKAQSIKAQFASVRMNGYQRDVATFVRDLLRIMTGLIANLYSDEKIMSIVGTISEADQAHLPAASQVIRNDFQRMYKIDIEADSLTQEDWALEKEQRMEVVGQIGQLLSQAIPAVEASPELGPLMLGLVKFSISSFKGATEIEGLVDQQLDLLVKKAQNPEPPQPTPEEQKAQAEMQKMQVEMQMATKKAEQDAILKQQEMANKLEIEKMQAQADMATGQQKAALESQVAQQKMENDRVMMQMELEFKREMQQLELAGKREDNRMKMELAYVQGEQKARQAEQQGAIKTQQMKEQQNAKPKSKE